MEARGLLEKERNFLREQGYNPENFMFLGKTAEGYEFLEVQTGKILSLRR